MDRRIDQWDRPESPEIKSLIYGHIIVNKGAKTIQWGKYSLFNKWCLGQLESNIQNNEIEPLLYHIQKLNGSKGIKILNIRAKYAGERSTVEWQLMGTKLLFMLIKMF